MLRHRRGSNRGLEIRSKFYDGEITCCANARRIHVQLVGFLLCAGLTSLTTLLDEKVTEFFLRWSEERFTTR